MNGLPLSSWIRLPSGLIDISSGKVPKNLHVFFRHEFIMAKTPRKAMMRISADDCARLYVNGILVWMGPAPGYLHRYYYAEIDIMPFLRQGVNTLAVHNYYQGLVNRVWNSGDDFYGIIGDLNLTFTDGSEEHFSTGGNWRCFRCEAYEGKRTFGYETQFAEDIDQGLIPANWTAQGFDDSGWDFAELVPPGLYPHQLIRQETPPVKFYEVKPEVCRRIGADAWIFDFGVEVVGTTIIRLSLPAGTKVEVRHAEELDGNGRALYNMRANCEYREFCILDGSGTPLEFFDYKGFRYVELVGIENELSKSAVTVRQRHYPVDSEASSFGCCDERLNRIWEICRRATIIGTQDSYLDCPTREKGAYLGDAMVTGLAHLYLSGDPRILKKVLSDFAASQILCPGIKAVAPGAFLQDIADYSLLWTPLLREYFLWTNDLDFVRSMLQVIEDLLEYFAMATGEHGLLVNFTSMPVMVDWPDNLRDGFDDPGLMGSGCPQKGINTVLNLYYSITLDAAAKLFAVAGDDTRTGTLTKRNSILRHSILKYLCHDGLMTDTDTSHHSALHPNVLALFCGLKPSEGWEKILDLIREKRLSCGVYFSLFLLQGLYNAGEADLAYDLMTCDDSRSWMTMLNAGATTCLEAWGPDQKRNTSWCHPWAAAPVVMTASGLFGLRPAIPGWKTIDFRPQIPAGLERGKLRITVPAGKIDVAFKQQGDSVEFTVDLPESCEMICCFQERFKTITLNGKKIQGGGHTIKGGKMKGIPFLSPVLSGVFGILARSSIAGEPSQQWTKEKAWKWYDSVAPILGVNYVPSTAVNMLEWWQKDTFDPETIDRELKLAKDCGYNSVRCNLSFEVWESDGEGLKHRLEQFFGIAEKHNVGVMLCLFDDVNFANANPVAGKQAEPVPGVHNSRWVPSPASAKVADQAAWPALEKYVKDIVGKFSKDKRLLVWDLYNEPGNGGLNNNSLPLVKASFEWARAMNPEQPITVGPWRDYNSEMSKTMTELSDIVTFHNYENAGEIEGSVKFFQKYERPVLCTETIRRRGGQDYAAVLPVFAKNKVSWYNWGLVVGKQLTYLPWEQKGQSINDPWNWDMLWPDGKPYDPKEIELVKNFKFTDPGV